uniref:Serine/threonine kinase 4 n=1 Tax=Sus scrofa TaxID=9823 RepID=A0A8D0Q0Q0_PIG
METVQLRNPPRRQLKKLDEDSLTKQPEEVFDVLEKLGEGYAVLNPILDYTEWIFMDHLLVKNISHYLFVSWKNTLWNQARNQAETRSKKMTPAVLLKDKYKMNLKPRVDLASLKIYGCLHEGSWKFPCKGITREKTSKASDLPI